MTSHHAVNLNQWNRSQLMMSWLLNLSPSQLKSEGPHGMNNCQFQSVTQGGQQLQFELYSFMETKPKLHRVGSNCSLSYVQLYRNQARVTQGAAIAVWAVQVNRNQARCSLHIFTQTLLGLFCRVETKQTILDVNTNAARDLGYKVLLTEGQIQLTLNVEEMISFMHWCTNIKGWVSFFCGRTFCLLLQHQLNLNSLSPPLHD